MKENDIKSPREQQKENFLVALDNKNEKALRKLCKEVLPGNITKFANEIFSLYSQILPRTLQPYLPDLLDILTVKQQEFKLKAQSKVNTKKTKKIEML